ncbi:Transmembrane domain-containing protein [Spironucleus salmonicida]|uniref:Transmembrane domain-containing protein n=1 Tax=Spironucleus salmonicida TaxID=348837 RepID=V6LUU1_9EUKA|nr:Transmembrane domain-containing protein [Spironucleus salmonicida]|eukprot:EST44574.1 Transmembrane domain-containing protein [Spironucleus salmonicida]
MESQLKIYPLHKTVVSSISLLAIITAITSQLFASQETDFFSKFAVPILLSQIAIFPFEHRILFFYLQSVAISAFALHAVQIQILAASVLAGFAAVITASNCVSQTVISVFSGYSLFLLTANTKYSYLSAAAVMLFSVSYGDFGACLIAIFSQFDAGEKHVQMLVSGVFAGIAGMALREFQSRKEGRDKVRRMQGHAVQNAFVTVRR